MFSDSLSDCLSRELTVVRDFTELLKEETSALSSRAEPAELAEITERKTQAHDMLSTLAGERDEILASADLPAGHIGTEWAVIDDEALREQWQELQEAATEARALNERNGMLVRTHLRNAQQAMRAIRMATGADLYGADGRQPSAALGRRL